MSAHRQEQAARTRSVVLDAALKMFPDAGWTSTTIAGIAKAAGVSKETIYAVWGSKTAILAELVQRAVRGSDADTPLLQQGGVAAVMAAPTAEAKIELFATDIAGVLSRVAPLLDVVRTAAGSDADSAALYRTLHEGRRRNLAEVAKALGPDLRAGLTVTVAAEEIWRQASPELYLLLTRQGGFDGKRYASWLAATLKRLLLEDLRG